MPLCPTAFQLHDGNTVMQGMINDALFKPSIFFLQIQIYLFCAIDLFTFLFICFFVNIYILKIILSNLIKKIQKLLNNNSKIKESSVFHFFIYAYFKFF